MGFFAIIALALAIAAMVFDLTLHEDEVLDAFEWAIVSLFALEYVVNLARAKDRLAFVVSGWRVLDLVIIVGPVATIILHGVDPLRATPAVLRLLRVIVFSARLGGLAVRDPRRAAPPAVPEVAKISVFRGSGPPRSATWEEVRKGLMTPPADEWYHASGLDKAQVAEIARDAGISPAFAQTLGETEYPRVEVYDRFSALFTWIPHLGLEDDATVERKGVLLFATDYALLTVAKHGIDLQDDLVAVMDDMALPKGTFATRTILGIMKLVLRRYEEVAGHLERHARALELAPVRDSRPEFLEKTFRIQRQVSAIKSDLWRLKGILEAISEGRLSFHGLSNAPVADAAPEKVAERRAANEYLRVLIDEADYVYETVFNAREGLLSLIDLHLNVVSFEMNKVMRVLAVVSAMGLVPTVVGGLLGMNVIGNPWQVTLPEVTFGVATAMILLLYVFLVKGWLR
jgi:Mg2+ and Co2+ transporter CorA